MTDNTFKPHTFVLKEDGKIYYVPDVPKVVRPCSDRTVITCESYNRAVEKKALQSAIANGIEVENDENYRRVIERIKWSIYVENSGFKQPKGFLEIVDTISVDEGKLYTLYCMVEVIEEWIPGQGYNSPAKEIARVTFEQPEKKRVCNHDALIDTGVGYDVCPICNSSFPHIEPEAAGQEQDLWEKMLIRYDQARILRRGLKEVAKELMQEYTLTRKP